MHSGDNFFPMDTENRTNLRKENSLILQKVKALQGESMWRSEDEVGEELKESSWKAGDLSCKWS